ncbi:hypothetical protein D9619_011482 [Psilocybe cf. subviscida]|uniref:NADH:flavin oxidoreductase/NADH oxidase N-terminal domain-containing protein n=1 Tax=Psilocybe cf. subviscida TaxID=2480587 RepID=A0A8H5F9I6_9AGAR|nr:hypothetical protein D9619_011482 [Psilocybe cf. subviscida]
MHHPLFAPLCVGRMQLQHRVVFAPITRLRASSNSEGRVPVNPLMTTYYEQRSRRPGTLIISEGALILEEESGTCLERAPGVWGVGQVKEWKKIAEVVHANKSFIFLQLWAQGRPLQPSTVAPRANNFPPTPQQGEIQCHRHLTISKMHACNDQYVQAARNAINGAGCDGVEVHAGSGYVLDQFLQDVTNQRPDEYGGSVERRSKFPLEVVKAVASAVGEERVGVRISPWSTYQGMGMVDPIPQFTHFVRALRESHPRLAYLHVVEPEMDEAGKGRRIPEQSNSFLRKLWLPRPLITCEGYDRESAMRRVKESPGELVAFGRYFVSNPDLPDRLEHGIPLTPYDPSTFYQGGEQGYIDYPFASKKRE